MEHECYIKCLLSHSIRIEMAVSDEPLENSKIFNTNMGCKAQRFGKILHYMNFCLLSRWTFFFRQWIRVLFRQGNMAFHKIELLCFFSKYSKSWKKIALGKVFYSEFAFPHIIHIYVWIYYSIKVIVCKFFSCFMNRLWWIWILNMRHKFIT